MTIETKFNIGDEIWFIHNNKALSTIVRGVKIEVPPSSSIAFITYLCNNENDKQVSLKVGEVDSFSSKEELLASL